jgi:predicted nucleic acid-binding protein
VRIVVADTGPLHYLVLIDAVQILPRLFDRVVVPDAVYGELLAAGAPDQVRHWTASPPPWLSVQPAPFNDDADLRSLHEGERAAIALAVVLRPDLLLIDDRQGVAVARRRGFALTGTLGMLALAARHGLIDLEAAFAALQSTNFHAKQDLYGVLLAQDRERRTR